MEQIRPLRSSKSQWVTFYPKEDVADFPHLFRTTIEEITRGEDKIKTQREIKTEVHKITLHKNNATNVEIRLAQTIFKHVQSEIKFARNVQTVDILQRSVVEIM